MPVVRLCPYCKKGFLKSTYQMLAHVEKCDNYKPIIITINNDKISKTTNPKKSTFKITKIADEIKPDILFSYKSQDPK